MIIKAKFLVVIGSKEYFMDAKLLAKFIDSMNKCGLLQGVDYTVERIS